jgi:hypothetical protein
VFLDVIYFINKPAAVCLSHARAPAFVPGGDRIGKRLVPLFPDMFGEVIAQAQLFIQLAQQNEAPIRELQNAGLYS